MNKDLNKSKVSLDDTFDKDYKEILDLQDSRPDPLKKPKFPIEKRAEEVINYDFEKET